MHHDLWKRVFQEVTNRQTDMAILWLTRPRGPNQWKYSLYAQDLGGNLIQLWGSNLVNAVALSFKSLLGIINLKKSCFKSIAWLSYKLVVLLSIIYFFFLFQKVFNGVLNFNNFILMVADTIRSGLIYLVIVGNNKKQNNIYIYIYIYIYKPVLKLLFSVRLIILSKREPYLNKPEMLQGYKSYLFFVFC